MTRRRFVFSSLAAGTAAAAWPCFWEPRWLELSRRTAALGAGRIARPVRILHLSDLHASMFVPQSLIDRAIAMGLAEKPDLICVTGDFITHREDFDRPNLVRSLQRLSSFAPTFGVVGNHDGGRWSKSAYGLPNHHEVDRILEESGVHLLNNRSTHAVAAGVELSLVGVADLWNQEIHVERAFAEADSRLPTIFLAHNPDSKDVAARRPWDLMLSGHTHGGQVVLPFYGDRLAPVQDRRYVVGLKPWRGRQVHVTRGVGSHLGIRFHCRPEVSVVTVA